MTPTTLAALVDEGVRILRLMGSFPSGDPAGPARLTTRSPVEYRLDVMELAAYVLQVPRSDLRMDGVLTEAQSVEFRTLVHRRAEGIPLGYLTGMAVFGGVPVTVGPGVFVPRTESELVLAEGLRSLDGISHPIVVDLCTGSAAVALAVAHARPDATVHAVDIDPVAIDYARRNSDARIARGDTAIVLHLADATAPDLLSELDGTVDLLLAEPPFMRDEDKSWLVAEFSEHQPSAAIFSGPDGLGMSRAVVEAAFRLLRPGGVCIIEHGPLHGDTLPVMLAADGRFVEVSAHRDLDGWPLYAVATRTADSSVS